MNMATMKLEDALTIEQGLSLVESYLATTEQGGCPGLKHLQVQPTGTESAL